MNKTEILKFIIGVILTPILLAIYFIDRQLLVILPHLQLMTIRKWFEKVENIFQSSVRIVAVVAIVLLVKFFFWLFWCSFQICMKIKKIHLNQQSEIQKLCHHNSMVAFLVNQKMVLTSIHGRKCWKWSCLLIWMNMKQKISCSEHQFVFQLTSSSWWTTNQWMIKN